MKSLDEVKAQIARIQNIGATRGTGVSYTRFARAAGRVYQSVITGQRLNPFAKGDRYQTNAYLLNRGKGLSNG